ncbi:MFS transporter [Consotaella salsifontis]|uniref:Na+/melibiose symporter n=1 Tax=Consotaella salsifontis TaxID=1365950 RepID=A0A1T4S760_9HYPH|nr:MFS transporter [Consotaella salsifontis]SKA24099.1 Na+/melibiose symporter [Consotaella salsifontis]
MSIPNITSDALRYEEADTPFVSGRRRWTLLVSLLINNFVLLALYCGVLGVLLPNQIAALDPENKAANLAILFAITSVFSTLTTPIAGALSDRTRSRWGRRSPWIAFGALVGAAALFGVSFMTTLVSITVIWVMATVALNSMQPALTTVVADRFAISSRGIAGGFVGAGMTAGVAAGPFIAGRLANQMVAAYGLFAAAIAVTCVAFVLINREAPSLDAKREKFDFVSFLNGFWKPLTSHDFAWAFAGRFVIYMGYQAIATYLLYILQDYIKLSNEEANITIGNLASLTFVFVVIASLGGGYLSDWMKRRKPFVFFASLFMTAAMVVPLWMPTVEGMYIYAALIGIGYGAFMSIDLALMTQVLPKTDEDNAGKDLGVLTTAINIPQIISPPMAAILLSMFDHDYRVLFIVAVIFVGLGSFFVLPIRSVK